MSAHNYDGSRPSNGVSDNLTVPLMIGPEQPLANASSMLLNPGTDGGDERAPAPVPMYPYGFEGQGDDLFTLEPGTKG